MNKCNAFFLYIKSIFACLVCAIFLIPEQVKAFSVAPLIIDEDFASAKSAIDERISVINTAEVNRTYEAILKQVIFAQDGTIASFTEVMHPDHASVSPTTLTLETQKEGVFVVTFPNPNSITSADTFALLIEERHDGDVIGNVAVLIFPKYTAEEVLPAFRIDAFGAKQEGTKINIAGQWSNTGEALVHLSSWLVISNARQKEIARIALPDYRLPQKTSRAFAEWITLPQEGFGWWHLGGDVTLTLISMAQDTSILEQAQVRIPSSFGFGIWVIGGVLLGVGCGAGIYVNRKRKHGILQG